MAGLLDFIVGDDQVRDAEGLTQADRRIPYWQAAQSSLAKMGGLLMAAGQPLHHDQRAQYLAQAGGALGGFSGDVMAAKSEMAKQRLAQQTVQTNRTKLATLERMKAYAQSAEGQQAMAGLKPHEQFAAKVALDGGDIDAFGRIMSGVGAAEHRNRMAEINEANMKLRERALETKEGGLQAAPDRAAHGFLLRGMKDPSFRSSEEYAWALDVLGQERKAPDGSTIPGINKDAYPPSTYKPQWQQPQPPAAGPPGTTPPAAAPPGTVPPAAPPATAPPGAPKTPQQMAQELKPGDEVTLPNGIVISKNLTGVVEWDVPGVGEREGERWRQPPGGRPERQPPLKPIGDKELDVLTTTSNTLRELEDLDKELKNPKVQLGDVSTYLLPNNALNLTNPEGVRARAIIGALAAKKVNDLSGAAVSEAEYKRIEPFIPKNTDTPSIVRTKLIGLKRELEAIGKARFHNIPAGSRISPELKARYGKGAGPPAPTPAPPDSGPPVRKYNPKTGKLED